MPEVTVSNYPTALDDDTSLAGNVVNMKSFVLNANIDDVTTTIPTTATIAGINSPCYLLLDNELIYAPSKVGSDFTSCVRGADGTVAAAHTSGINIDAVYSANLFNQLKRAIVAIETELGISPSGSYDTVLARLTNLDFYKNLPDGTMFNGKLSPSVSSNNLTLALKTYAGANPSASDPVYIKINGTFRTCTSALSVTKNAGTNWFNAGSAELATKEIDYFVYIGYNATDGIVIGFSRIPYAKLYNDFSVTTTNEKYAAISTITTAAAGDDYAVIGRFAATLSAGAGYTWTVPTYTTVNLIQAPIFRTRWLTWTPTWSTTNLGGTTGTFSSVSVGVAKYMIEVHDLNLQLQGSGTLGGSACPFLAATAPFDAAQAALNITAGPMLFADTSATSGAFGGIFIFGATPDLICFDKYNQANWANSGGATISARGEYEI